MTGGVRVAERAGLWRNGPFTRFWTASTTSMFGATLTAVAVPIIAVRDLGATPAQMGLLVAAGIAPGVLLRLPAAAWADATTVPASRVIRRAQLVSGLIVASIPVLWLLDALRFTVLALAVAAVSAVSKVIEGFAAPLLPRLVPVAQLAGANGRFQVSRNAAEVAGPGMAGLLFQVLAAPVVLVLDTASYLAASVLMRSMPDDGRRDTEQGTGLGTVPAAGNEERRDPAGPHGLVRGFWSVFQDSFLRRCMVIVGCTSLANGAVQALVVILMVRLVGLSATTVGLVFAAGAFGGIVAGATVGWTRARLGLTPTVILASALLVSSFAGLPFATAGWPGAAAVVYYELAGSFGATLMLVSVFSEIPARVPRREIARSFAVANIVPEATALAGALLGGLLAADIGVPATLAAGLAVAVLSSLGIGGYLSYIHLTRPSGVST